MTEGSQAFCLCGTLQGFNLPGPPPPGLCGSTALVGNPAPDTAFIDTWLSPPGLSAPWRPDSVLQGHISWLPKTPAPGQSRLLLCSQDFLDIRLPG